jgi:hypothetical protein
VTAADALGRIEENASRFSVEKFSGWNQVSVLLSQSVGRSVRHAASSVIISNTDYHVFFVAVKLGDRKSKETSRYA